jgi:hypothetical protein
MPEGGNKMSEPRMQVDCTVDNCKFNRDHLCYAHGIKVDAKGDHHANTNDGTFCSTFIDEH